jgi:hypothetical protein
MISSRPTSQRPKPDSWRGAPDRKGCRDEQQVIKWASRDCRGPVSTARSARESRTPSWRADTRRAVQRITPMFAIMLSAVSRISRSKNNRADRPSFLPRQVDWYSCQPMKTFTLRMAILATMAADLTWAVERRPAATTSCQAAQQAIERDGAIILQYPSKRVTGFTLYNRYVRSGFQCDGNDDAVLQSVDAASGETAIS